MQLYVGVHRTTLCYVNRTYGFISDIVALYVVLSEEQQKDEIPESKEDGQNKKENEVRKRIKRNTTSVRIASYGKELEKEQNYKTEYYRHVRRDGNWEKYRVKVNNLPWLHTHRLLKT